MSSFRKQRRRTHFPALRPSQRESCCWSNCESSEPVSRNNGRSFPELRRAAVHGAVRDRGAVRRSPQHRRRNEVAEPYSERSECSSRTSVHEDSRIMFHVPNPAHQAPAAPTIGIIKVSDDANYNSFGGFQGDNARGGAGRVHNLIRAPDKLGIVTIDGPKCKNVAAQDQDNFGVDKVRNEAAKPFAPPIRKEEASKPNVPSPPKEKVVKPVARSIRNEEAAKPIVTPIRKEEAARPNVPSSGNEEAAKPIVPPIKNEEAAKPEYPSTINVEAVNPNVPLKRERKASKRRTPSIRNLEAVEDVPSNRKKEEAKLDISSARNGQTAKPDVSPEKKEVAKQDIPSVRNEERRKPTAPTKLTGGLMVPTNDPNYQTLAALQNDLFGADKKVFDKAAPTSGDPIVAPPQQIRLPSPTEYGKQVTMHNPLYNTMAPIGPDPFGPDKKKAAK